MSDIVERAVATALPDRTITDVHPETVRPGNQTARVSFADADPVYVKTASDTELRLVREIAATRYAAAHCGVGTPTIVAAEADSDPPYLVTEPLPGRRFNDAWTGSEAGPSREELLRLVGRAVAGVHEAEFDRAGVVLGGDADALDLGGRDWPDVLARTIRWRAEDWFADRFLDLPERLIDVLGAVWPEIEGTPTLVHGDHSRVNVHYDPLGLLDWERTLVGDPAFGLVDAEFHHLGQPDVAAEERERLRAALYAGYRAHAGDLPAGLERHRAIYRAISYLLVPQAFEDWSEDADRPADELAAEVREEFEARLAAARETVE